MVQKDEKRAEEKAEEKNRMNIGQIFEPGNRKTTMTLIALVGSVLLEKYGGGLSESLRETILYILAIFTGGNVLSKGIRAVEEVKVAKYAEPIIPELPPEEELPLPPVPQSDERFNELVKHVNQLDNMAGQRIQELQKGMEEISGRLDTQVKNLSQVLTIINGMRNGQQQA